MKLSLVIPTYNSMEYVQQCIDSALNQDYDNYDIHVYDNGSTDGTLEYLQSLLEKQETITLHQVPNIYKNSYREAVDHCFQNLETDYITFLSADDYLDPSYVSKCMKIFSHDSEKIKCIQSGIINVQDGRVVGKQIHFYKNLTEFKDQAMQRSPVNTPTVVYHKSLYSLMQWTPYGGEAHKANNLTEAGAGDYDMFCGFANENIFIYPVDACLGYYYRWHKDQCTWDVIKQKQEGVVDFEKVIQGYWREKWKM